MNAYVMAAGRGERLGSLTEIFPKCLLRIGERPMLEWWLDILARSRCFESISVNVHHHADKVEDWIATYFERTGRVINVIDERIRLLGTAGTLFWYADSLEDFCVVYVDTFSRKAFAEFPLFIEEWKMAKAEGHVAGILVFDSPKDGSSGTLVADRNGVITSFVEKSEYGSKAWAGILFGSNEFLNYVQASDRDLARDVLPRLVGRMKVLDHVDAYDIGRGEEAYERAEERIGLFPARKHKA